MKTSYGETTLSNGPGAFGHALILADGPLDLTWHHAGTTSEFIGEFYALSSAALSLDANEARHSIGYLVNELLENAVKFRHPGDISISTSIEDGRFEIKVSNLVSRETADRFRPLLEEITTRDPGELLIERIEANAEDASSSASGLGLLTLMSDYGASLGWEFRQEESNKAAVRLDTFAALTLS